MDEQKQGNPAERILFALKRAETGDYSTRIDTDSIHGELRIIAHALNHLLTKTEKRITSLENFIEDLTADASRYRNIIDSIEESYFEVDLKGTLQFFNERVSLDLGYAEEELYSMHFSQLTDQENATKLYQAFHHVFLTGQPIKSFRWDVLKKNKEKLSVEASISLRRNEKGAPIGFRGIVRDISERKKAEDELRLSEERYRTILEITEEGYLENDLKGNVIFANDMACRLIGYEKEQLIGKNYRDYLTPNVADHMRQLFHHIYVTGKPQLLVDYDLVRRDGTVKNYQMNAALMRDGAGHPCGFRILTRDMSLYKQTKDALQKSQEKYRNILENMAETYLEMDLQGHFVFFNDSLCRVLGYSRDELQNADYRLITPPDHLDNISKAFHDIYATGKPKTFSDYELIAKNNSAVYMNMSFSLLRSPSGEPIGFFGLGRDVTEEVQNRRKIEESERHLRIITQNIRDVIWTMDFDLHYTYVSPSVSQLLGFTVEEVQQMPLRQVLPPERFNRIKQMLAEQMNDALQGGAQELSKTVTFEMPMMCKNGKTIWVEITANFNLDENGKPFEIVGVTRDISERKKAATHLLESEKRYRTITENVNDIVWIINLDMQITYVSPSNEALTGFTPAELMRHPLQHFLAPDSYAYASRIVAEELDLEHSGLSLDPNRSRTLEIEILSKKGENIWVEVSATFNRDANGKATEILAVGRNITQRRMMEEALADSERRYRMIVENMNEIIWTLGPNLQFIYVSPSSLRMTGYSPEETRQTPLTRLLSPDSYALATQRLADELALEASGKPFDPHRAIVLEIEAIHKNGDSLWLEISGTFNRDQSGRIKEIVVVGKNITERKKAEAEKRHLEQQLNQAQKMETIGRLAGGVAHDFNNMLSVILGYVDLAKLRLAKQHPVLQDIAEIERAAIRSRDITTQLLAFSRKQIIEPRIVDLNEMVIHTQKALTRLIGEDIDLKVKFGRNLWPIKFDPSQIEQILINLAVNARDAMPNGGKLTIETFNTVIDPLYCENHIGVVPGDYIQLNVSDTGIGMDEDTLQHIFEPFFTTKEAGKGTGLGLATVYGIVRQNEGFIHVYSEPGFGSTFSIYLPRTTETAEEKNPSEEEPVFAGQGNILLVEDDPMVLKIAQNMLESMGFTVTAVKEPAEVIAIYETPERSFDLVITDVIMPSMSGKDLKNKLQTIRPEGKFLFMSGYTADVIAHHGVLEKGVHFLQKPFTLKSLAGKVAEALSTKPA
jgi:PAS domain S-box-containing protein